LAVSTMVWAGIPKYDFELWKFSLFGYFY